MNNQENNCQECQFEERNGHALTCSHTGEGEEKIEYGYGGKNQYKGDTRHRHWCNFEIKDFISAELAHVRKEGQEEILHILLGVAAENGILQNNEDGLKYLLRSSV